MKLSSQEEYGLRCLLQLARQPDRSLAIPEIGLAEGISAHNVAKLLRILRQGSIVESERGQHGGYTLARPSHEITVGEVLAVLGGAGLLSELLGNREGLHPLFHSVLGSGSVAPAPARGRRGPQPHDAARPTALRRRRLRAGGYGRNSRAAGDQGCRLLNRLLRCVTSAHRRDLHFPSQNGLTSACRAC